MKYSLMFALRRNLPSQISGSDFMEDLSFGDRTFRYLLLRYEDIFPPVLEVMLNIMLEMNLKVPLLSLEKYTDYFICLLLPSDLNLKT